MFRLSYHLGGPSSTKLFLRSSVSLWAHRTPWVMLNDISAHRPQATVINYRRLPNWIKHCFTDYKLRFSITIYWSEVNKTLMYGLMKPDLTLTVPKQNSRTTRLIKNWLPCDRANPCVGAASSGNLPEQSRTKYNFHTLYSVVVRSSKFSNNLFMQFLT